MSAMTFTFFAFIAESLISVKQDFPKGSKPDDPKAGKTDCRKAGKPASPKYQFPD